MQTELPILVVGAGPVGLSLALGLARHGVPVRVFEAEEDLSSEMRASTLHASTLEMFAEWGAADSIVAAGRIADRLQYWERSSKTKIAEFSYDLIAEDTAFPFRLQCPQNIVTRTLRAQLEQIDCCELYFGHRALSVQDTGDRVVLELDTDQGTQRVEGAYIVGCDGSRSVVRKSADFTFTGKTYADRFLLIGTQIDFSRFFEDVGPVAYIYDPDEWAILMHLPTLVRTVFRVQADEDAAALLTDSAIRKRMAGLLGQEVDFEIEHKSIYSVHQRIADRFREGRIILAGDAAHLNNPAGGMGLNSGVHDAYLLVQTLTQIWQGASDTLLDDYSSQRHRVAQDLIQAASDKNYKDLIIRDWKARSARNQAMQATSEDPAAAREYLLDAALLRQRPRPMPRGQLGA